MSDGRRHERKLPITPTSVVPLGQSAAGPAVGVGVGEGVGDGVGAGAGAGTTIVPSPGEATLVAPSQAESAAPATPVSRMRLRRL